MLEYVNIGKVTRPLHAFMCLVFFSNYSSKAGSSSKSSDLVHFKAGSLRAEGSSNNPDSVNTSLCPKVCQW